MYKRDRIYLVGMPASGKTTIGRELSLKMNYQFFDFDELLSRKKNLSITEIFQKKGEKYFRKKEIYLLTHFLPKQSVLSTGGGLLQTKESVVLLKKKGISIFLDVPIPILYKRILKQQSLRPLFSKEKQTNLIQKIILKYAQRIKYYKQADFIIKIDNLKTIQVTNKIVQLIN